MEEAKESQRARSSAAEPSLRMRYVGGSEVNLTEESNEKNRKNHYHVPISISQAIQTPIAPPAKHKKILDGFLLLEASGAHLPADSRKAELVDKNLYGVLEEDLVFHSLGVPGRL